MEYCLEVIKENDPSGFLQVHWLLVLWLMSNILQWTDMSDVIHLFTSFHPPPMPSDARTDLACAWLYHQFQLRKLEIGGHPTMSRGLLDSESEAFTWTSKWDQQ